MKKILLILMLIAICNSINAQTKLLLENNKKSIELKINNYVRITSIENGKVIKTSGLITLIKDNNIVLKNNKVIDVAYITRIGVSRKNSLFSYFLIGTGVGLTSSIISNNSGNENQQMVSTLSSVVAVNLGIITLYEVGRKVFVFPKKIDTNHWQIRSK